MKKVIAICAVALSLGAFADTDSYLYWFVQDPVTWKTGDTAADYDTVRIGVLNSSGDKVTDSSGSAVYLSLYSISDTSLSSGSESMSLDLDSGLGNSGYAALGTYAGDGYSYYIELLNDTTFAGRSVDTLAYSSTATGILTDITQTSIPSSAWSSATYTTSPVPEPTSGMLLLFGLAGLALRRKRA